MDKLLVEITPPDRLLELEEAVNIAIADSDYENFVRGFLAATTLFKV